jgi:hypothetical protein
LFAPAFCINPIAKMPVHCRHFVEKWNLHGMRIPRNRSSAVVDSVGGLARALSSRRHDRCHAGAVLTFAAVA